MRLILDYTDAAGTPFRGNGGNLISDQSVILVDHATSSNITIEAENPAYTLGPGTNTFTTATTRNTYFANTDNAGILAQYNDDRTLLILVGTATQRRDAAGTAWEAASIVQWLDATMSLIGAAGISADGVHSFIGRPDLKYRVTPAAAGSRVFLSEVGYYPA